MMVDSMDQAEFEPSTLDFQIQGLLEGDGSSKDNQDVVNALIDKLGLAETTARRLHLVMCHGEKRLLHSDHNGFRARKVGMITNESKPMAILNTAYDNDGNTFATGEAIYVLEPVL